MNSKADGSGTRNLLLNSNLIFFDFWIAAQEWDEANNIGCKVHHNLTAEMVNLDKSSKMRNSFAFLALDEKMLELMKVIL